MEVLEWDQRKGMNPFPLHLNLEIQKFEDKHGRKPKLYMNNWSATCLNADIKFKEDDRPRYKNGNRGILGTYEPIEIEIKNSLKDFVVEMN